MSINGDGFQVDPEELRGGASDILKCLEPAKGIEFGALNEDFGASEQEDVILDGKFEQFCDTWDVAYLVLGDRSDDAAGKLKTFAHNYEQTDAYVDGRMHPYGAGR
ncbi:MULTISPECIES: hypothetical protein [Streptomyces]|uniref:Uncharacterized protein n=2 Tax=Streptomyces TaxID=1883 RepID=A0A2N8PMG4_STRNR|nr:MULTISPECIES: hypothetical protein [Streptomyces]PNE42219.1 hypothetical protein AOB60_17070 [Streptomyces noursei]SHK73356.1 hypothetical protein SAMN05216268_101139 [Streptomyces yunnanensis]